MEVDRGIPRQRNLPWGVWYLRPDLVRTRKPTPGTVDSKGPLRLHSRAPQARLVCAAFFLAGLAPRAAYARACAAATDCPQPGFGCDLGSDGGAGECAGLACTSDADCGVAMRCLIALEGCKTTTDGGSSCVGWCGPQWDEPCLTAEDCGPGFRCGGSVSYFSPYECGPAPSPIPPYATRTQVPCSILVPPDLSAALVMAITGSTDGGGECCPGKAISCVPETPLSCAIDSDCPPTWTCQCSTCGWAGAPDPSGAGEAAFDAACAKRCVAPNADLENPVCGTTMPPPDPNAGPSTSPALPEGGFDSGSARPKTVQESESAPGGCQIGGTEATPGWPLGAIAVFGWASRRRSRAGRRPTR
jgi:hypothetical protein